MAFHARGGKAGSTVRHFHIICVDMVENSLRIALDAFLNSEQEVRSAAHETGIVYPVVLKSLQYFILWPLIGLSASAAYPDKVILSPLKANTAYINEFAMTEIHMHRCLVLPAYLTRHLFPMHHYTSICCHDSVLTCYIGIIRKYLKLKTYFSPTQ